MPNVHHLAKFIVPIVAVFNEDEVIPLGTGFIVGTMGNKAIIATATHNIEHAHEKDRPPPTHHRTTLPEFLPKTNGEYIWKNASLFALLTDGNGTTVNASIDRCWFDKNRDVAFCGIGVNDSLKVPSILPFDKKIRISSRGPEKGDSIVAIGFPNYIDLSHEFNFKKSPHTIFSFDIEMKINEGKVLEVHDIKGPGNHRWPCFQVDCPLLSGMSGGPILIERDNELIACGIVSSDLQLGENKASGEHAFASIMWTSSYIKTDLFHTDTDTGNVAKLNNILDFMKIGIIEDLDNAGEHVEIIYNDQGIPSDLVWK